MPQEEVFASRYNDMVRTPTGKEIQRMKTRRLATVLTSAYLSAMLASSVAPIGRSLVLAAPIDPSTAQAAFNDAVGRLDAVGWIAASAAAPTPAPAIVKVLPANPPVPDPGMTEELLARIIKFTLGRPSTKAIDAKICKIFDMCDGTVDMPMKVIESEVKEHFIAMSPIPGSKDIVIMYRENGSMHCFLTDKTGVLRAAAVSVNGEMKLITNEKAAASYKTEMTMLAKEAGGLPPTGTAVAGNS